MSARELEILRLMACGMSNGGIAADLVLSGSTVATHVLQGLRVRDRVPAVIVTHEAALMQRGAPGSSAAAA
ncbi:LuxR C-terminal-related transcriptional regulator [Paraconexibacter antarcticus]|nr:LuxR C-terminal-related transcriptional regulator [Paraconexibacter antarcticus]